MPGAPGKEAGLDATLAWVATTWPDIDLDSPPDPTRLRQHRRRLVKSPNPGRPQPAPLQSAPAKPPALASLGLPYRRDPWSTIPTIA